MVSAPFLADSRSNSDCPDWANAILFYQSHMIPPNTALMIAPPTPPPTTLIHSSSLNIMLHHKYMYTWQIKGAHSTLHDLHHNSTTQSMHLKISDNKLTGIGTEINSHDVQLKFLLVSTCPAPHSSCLVDGRRELSGGFGQHLTAG